MGLVTGYRLQVGKSAALPEQPRACLGAGAEERLEVISWSRAVSKDLLLVIPLGATSQVTVPCPGGMRGPRSPRADCVSFYHLADTVLSAPQATSYLTLTLLCPILQVWNDIYLTQKKIVIG